MAEANGSSNGEVKTTVLDGAKERFAARKKVATDAEIKGAFQAYFKAEDEVVALQEKLEAAKLKRTEAAKGVVELRGMSRVATKTRGTGQIVSRGESAWISFAKAEGEAVDI